MSQDHAIYNVGLKIILRRGDCVLFLTDAVGGHFDFPGGRINSDEYYTELEKIIEREVKEEIGDVKYKLRGPAFQLQRHFESKNLHIFLTFYEAEYTSGEISLSQEHSKYEWVDINKCNLDPSKFYNPQEYKILKQHLGF